VQITEGALSLVGNMNISMLIDEAVKNDSAFQKVMKDSAKNKKIKEIMKNEGIKMRKLKLDSLSTGRSKR
ncbi:MAG: hypothetical protein AB1394_16615, partial [Bacteroidota bacterium]